MEQPPVSSSLPLAPPPAPAPAPAAFLSSAVTGGCQVRCAGCRMILTVGPGLKEFVCPTCQLLQILPPDPMRPSSQVPAHGIDPSEIQLPCANCKAILNVPHGLSRFACPHCKMELAVDNEVATNVEQEEDGGGILGETFTEDRPPKLSIDPPHPDKPEQEISPSKEKLKVFLRIRPVVTPQKSGGVQKDVWPQRKKDASRTAKASGKKKSVVCLKVNDSHSVTLCSPQSLPNVRTKTEVYEGFSHVFCAESSQIEVYERMVNPLVEDFLKGKSGMLAAMGPSGSGKTHAVFGSAREPGMVSLALHRIFSTKQSNGSKCSRISYLSMFEIYFEQGKGEKMMDLLQGGDLYMQQSNIKGLQETAIHDVQQAESLIASGMWKRSTAVTNSNIHSSRSQCIINIRSGLDNIDEDAGAQSYTTLLIIVDLAGAERQKRTGNQVPHYDVNIEDRDTINCLVLSLMCICVRPR